MGVRQLLLLFCAPLLIAASPATDAEDLLKQGREKEALEVIEQAAKSGDPEAVDYLAWMYDEGRVVDQDLRRAVELYRSAAGRGNRHAQWRLGVMLDLGLGIREDPEEAFQWLLKAAAQGSAKAHASLGLMHAMGRGTPVNYSESMRHYREAARRGEPHGFYGIAVLHASGEGVPKDLTEALAWLSVAAMLEDRDAIRAIGSGQFRDVDGRAAIERANHILKEFGITGTIKFEDRRSLNDQTRT